MLTSPRRGATGIKQGVQRGATVIEFAMIAPLLFFLLFMIMELGILFWVNLTMQYAVREGARYAITGQSDYGPVDPVTKKHARYLAVIQTIKNSSMGLYDKVSPTIDVFDPVSKVRTDYTTDMFGAPDTIVVLQLTCCWPVVTPAWRLMKLLNPSAESCSPGHYAFSVAATMRNEDFP